MNATTMIDDFYVLQIGETEMSSRGLVVGQQDSPLNEEGKSEAQGAARVLAGHEFSALCHSTQQRGAETARIIAEECPCRLYPLENLNDRCWGAWEKQFMSMDEVHESEDKLPSGAEAAQAFRGRVLSCFEQGAGYPMPVLFVCDESILRVLCSEMGLDDSILIPGQVAHVFKQLGRWTYKTIV